MILAVSLQWYFQFSNITLDIKVTLCKGKVESNVEISLKTNGSDQNHINGNSTKCRKKPEKQMDLIKTIMEIRLNVE